MVKKGKVKSTFICLRLLFEEFHVRFGTDSLFDRYSKLIFFCMGYCSHIFFVAISTHIMHNGILLKFVALQCGHTLLYSVGSQIASVFAIIFTMICLRQDSNLHFLPFHTHNP
jgi:hypothetical protein